MIYLSIDIEASGPFPGLFSLVSIGAVPVLRKKNCWEVDEEQTYYAELKPLEDAGELPAATNIHGLTEEYLLEHGREPGPTMREFAQYFNDLTRRYKKVVPAAWPSSFDSPFIGWYMQYFLGQNPLGWSAFDIPSYGMGLFRCGRPALRNQMKKAGIEAGKNPNPHNALADAVEQGQTLAQLLNHAQSLKTQRKE
ncbi:MAG: hypothetical protein AB7S38_43075 [Vulcanimicrobiota bacterium]